MSRVPLRWLASTAPTAEFLRACVDQALRAELEALRNERDAAIDHLTKLAAVYEQEHGPDTGGQTQPWIAVRWIRTAKGR